MDMKPSANARSSRMASVSASINATQRSRGRPGIARTKVNRIDQPLISSGSVKGPVANDSTWGRSAKGPMGHRRRRRAAPSQPKTRRVGPK